MRDDGEHTPGPWRAYVSGGHRWLVTARTGDVARIEVAAAPAAAATEEANARLIAAAPDLLAAAQAAYRVLREGRGHMTALEWCASPYAGVVDDLYDAITATMREGPSGG